MPGGHAEICKSMRRIRMEREPKRKVPIQARPHSYIKRLRPEGYLYQKTTKREFKNRLAREKRMSVGGEYLSKRRKT